MGGVLQGEVGVQVLQPRIFRPECLELLQLRHAGPAVLLPPQ